MDKLINKFINKIKYLFEEIQYAMDQPTSLSYFLSKKWSENPEQFSKTFFGEPELIKKWRETYSGRRVLPTPTKFDKNLETGEYETQKTWTMDKDPDTGQKVAKRQGFPDVHYVKKELDPKRKQLALQNIVGQDVKIKGEKKKARVLDIDWEGSKSGNNIGPGAIKIWVGGGVDEDRWVHSNDIEFEPLYKGFEQSEIPPEVVLRRLTMPDNKFENFQRYIIEHVQDPDEGFFEFGDPDSIKGLFGSDPERQKYAEEEKRKAEKERQKELEKIINFLETMKKLSPSQRVRYLFNVITFAKGLSKKQKVQTPGERGQLKAVTKGDESPKLHGIPSKSSFTKPTPYVKSYKTPVKKKTGETKPGKGKV